MMSFRKLIALTTGSVTLATGFILFWTPIPVGVVLVPLGFYILGREFHWAYRILETIKARTGPFGRAVREAEDRAAAWFTKYDRPDTRR